MSCARARLKLINMCIFNKWKILKLMASLLLILCTVYVHSRKELLPNAVQSKGQSELSKKFYSDSGKGSLHRLVCSIYLQAIVILNTIIYVLVCKWPTKRIQWTTNSASALISAWKTCIFNCSENFVVT